MTNGERIYREMGEAPTSMCPASIVTARAQRHTDDSEGCIG